MVNLNFGMVLGAYFEESAKNNDKPTRKGKDFVLTQSNGQKAKFTYYQMQLNFFEYFSIKLALYGISFLLKLIGYIYLNNAEKENKISKIACYVINTFQQVHFALFNIVIIDLIYFASRTLVHSNLENDVKLVAYLFVFLGVYDIMEVWYKSSRVSIRPQSSGDQVHDKVN